MSEYEDLSLVSLPLLISFSVSCTAVGLGRQSTLLSLASSSLKQRSPEPFDQTFKAARRTWFKENWCL